MSFCTSDLKAVLSDPLVGPLPKIKKIFFL